MEIILLLSPHILELQPERIHGIDVFIPFNSDTDKELSWSISLFPSKEQQFKTILSVVKQS